MITTAAEFVRLRESEFLEEYTCAAHDEADLTVWLDLIEHYTEMRQWVAHNKTVPLCVSDILSLA